jgi:hypothetical protein
MADDLQFEISLWGSEGQKLSSCEASDLDESPALVGSVNDGSQRVWNLGNGRSSMWSGYDLRGDPRIAATMGEKRTGELATNGAGVGRRRDARPEGAGLIITHAVFVGAMGRNGTLLGHQLHAIRPGVVWWGRENRGASKRRGRGIDADNDSQDTDHNLRILWWRDGFEGI